MQSRRLITADHFLMCSNMQKQSTCELNVMWFATEKDAGKRLQQTVIAATISVIQSDDWLTIFRQQGACGLWHDEH